MLPMSKTSKESLIELFMQSIPDVIDLMSNQKNVAINLYCFVPLKSL